MTRALTLGLAQALHMLTVRSQTALKFALFVVMATICTLPADARPSCAPRNTVIERLAERYGETRQSIGLGANNQVMELYASSDSGSWTITVTNAAGTTCLIASGQAFETLAEQLPAKSDGA